MHTIPEILNFPDKTPIDSIQGNVSGVYERRDGIGRFKSSVQNATLEDRQGNKIKMVVWNHPDIKDYKGREVVIQGGMKITKGSYVDKAGKDVPTIELELGKASNIQPVTVRAAQEPAPQAGAVAQDAQRQAGKALQPIRGDKVGMALNNAVAMRIQMGEPFNLEDLAVTASDIIRLSNWLEAGNLVPRKPVTAEEKKEAAYKKLDNTTPEEVPPYTKEYDGGGDDDDLPF